MPSARLFLLMLIPTSLASAQSTLGPSLNLMVNGGPGVGGGCTQQIHVAAIGMHLTKPIVRRVVSLQFVGRGYWLPLSSSCIEVGVLRPPQPDGSFIVEQRVDLQSRSFTTTDIRLGINLPDYIATLSAGGGTTWRAGYNAPYFVAAIGLPLIDGVGNRFGFLAEYQWLRLTSDRARLTWLNQQLVVDEPLGKAHHWSHAVTIGVRVGMRL